MTDTSRKLISTEELMNQIIYDEFMNCIKQVQTAHPNLSDEDVAMLVTLGYKTNADMDEWTQQLCDAPIIKNITLLSFLNDAYNRSQMTN